MAFAGDDWRGRVGQGWAAEWQRTDRSFVGLTERLVAAASAALPPVSGQQFAVLDIGCGAGETSIVLADERADVDVTGLDVSTQLVTAAHDRGAGRSNCRFVEGDATVWRNAEMFDGALSRHGVMFFADPVGAFGHMRALVKPDAPLVFSCFRDRGDNPWASEAARLLGALPPANPLAPGPFAFADADRVEAILTAAGWHDVQATPVDYQYVAGSGTDPVADALDFFERIGPAASLIAALPEDERGSFRVRFAEVLATHLDYGAVRYPAAAWLWQARA